jgi:hypothetical protein
VLGGEAAAAAAAAAAQSTDLLSLIRSVREPRDEAALRLGERWFVRSGARAKAEKAALGLQGYLESVPPLSEQYEEDMQQIKKDVLDGRTAAQCFKDAELRAFLLRLEAKEADVKNRLCNVLTALVHRHPDVGYVQGMNEVALVLMGFMSDERAFWTMAAMVEDLRASDFYSRHPPMMNGFQSASAVFGELAASHFAALTAAVGGRGAMRDVAQLAAMKWWIVLFIDSAPLAHSLCVLDYFFRWNADNPLEGGDAALLRASLAIMADSEKDITHGKAPYPCLLAHARSIPLETLLAALADQERFFTAHQLLELERSARDTM